MDYNRRSRRGRSRMHNLEPTHLMQTKSDKGSTSHLLNALFSVFILASLITLIYLMLEYHCNVCKAKCELGNITKSIEDISINLGKINTGYQDLESKVVKFSEELPRIQSQIDFLETVANSVQRNQNVKCRTKCVAPIPSMDMLYKKHMEQKHENIHSQSTPRIEEIARSKI